MNTNTEEWGNIELPGLSDEELFKKNWNRVAAALGHAVSIETKQKISNSKSGQESYHKGKSRSFKGKLRINKSIESHSQETKQKISKSKLGKPSPKLGSTLPKEVIKKLCKSIQTPDGIFESRNDAAKFYNIAPATLSFRLKKYPDMYYYILK